MKNIKLGGAKKKYSTRPTTTLPDHLNSIFIGIMLGDGSLYKSSPTSSTRFEMSFGANYKKFAEHIELLFSEYIKTPLKLINIKGATNKIYNNYRLKTRSLPLFNKYYDLFYLMPTGPTGPTGQKAEHLQVL